MKFIYMQRAETAANFLRKHLSIEEGYRIEFDELTQLIINKMGNLSIEISESARGAMAIPVNKDSYKIIIEDTGDKDEMIQKLLHEMAHILLEPSKLPKQWNDIDSKGEQMADFFIRSFLLPKKEFIMVAFNNSIGEERFNIEGIAKEFKVSIELVIKRGADLLGWEC